MPDRNLTRTTPASPSTPPVQPTIMRTRLSWRDLFTGGRTGPLTILPTTLGRPLS
jgi:hypothetical protein